MRETAQADKIYSKEDMQKIKYADMHCDTLTECFDRGYALADCDLQINLEKLKESGCAAQCFAIFTQGADAARRFAEYLNFYKSGLSSCGNALLTVENLGFIGEDLTVIPRLAEEGVKMASLVWNYENTLAYPNLIFKDGVPLFCERERRGLKPLGRRALELLDENKIIVDISHLSDGGADEILSDRKIPIVASHSNAAEVCNVSRNLIDAQIKKIADCGGVVGVNFCKDFWGEGDTFSLVLRHILHVIKVGGEDVVAFGSDFDGIPAPPKLEGCEKMPALLEYLSDNGVTGAVLDKLCYKNFMRVLKEVS